jgi:hypothetical protein
MARELGGTYSARQAGMGSERSSLSEAICSSGDGLGILQPGSMTRGDRFAMTAPSGRARDRAICPAVARSSLSEMTNTARLAVFDS